MLPAVSCTSVRDVPRTSCHTACSCDAMANTYVTSRLCERFAVQQVAGATQRAVLRVQADGVPVAVLPWH